MFTARYELSMCTQFTLQVSKGLGRAMAQAVSPLLASAMVRFRSQVSQYKIFGGQCGTGTGGFPSVFFFPYQCHFTNAAYSFSYLRAALTRKTKDRSLGTI